MISCCYSVTITKGAHLIIMLLSVHLATMLLSGYFATRSFCYIVMTGLGPSCCYWFTLLPCLSEFTATLLLGTMMLLVKHNFMQTLNNNHF